MSENRKALIEYINHYNETIKKQSYTTEELEAFSTIELRKEINRLKDEIFRTGVLESPYQEYDKISKLLRETRSKLVCPDCGSELYHVMVSAGLGFEKFAGMECSSNKCNSKWDSNGNPAIY